MIHNPAQNDLVDLIQQESGRCVSILMKTHQSGRETNQNPIRFKNLVTAALEKFGDNDEVAGIRMRLENLAELERDFDFWQHQSAGLGVYVGSDFEQLFQLGHTVDDFVCVDDYFYTLPLAAAACGESSTRTLVLSWEKARLFASDGDETHEVVGDSFPVTFDELVAEIDAEQQLQYSTHTPGGGAPKAVAQRSTAMFHGHGGGEESIEASRELYLTRVGKRVADEIYNQDTPLVLFATDEVAGHFKSNSQVVVAAAIQGSPDGANEQTLAKQISEATKTIRRDSGGNLAEKLDAAMANDKGSVKIEEILVAAVDGRVDSLLLGNVEPRWGTFHREKRVVDVGNDQASDLVNIAVRETLLAGGSVRRLDNDARENFGAIYRY